VFNPHARYKLLWDGLVSLLVVYSVVMIPMRIAFEPKITYEAALMEQFVLLVFALDIIATFNTAIVDVNSETLITNRKQIAIQYLKGWFWIDTLSTFPFGYMAAYVSGGTKNLAALRAVRALRLFRVLKLFRVSKFNETLQNLRINPHIVNLVVLMLSIFFIAHIFACIWHFMALYRHNLGQDNTWVDVLGFAQTDIYDRYVASLYYVMVTMMTVGYGDIRAVTNSERVFAIVTMLTGGVVFGAMISRLASILEKRNPEAKALTHNMAELKSFLVDIKLPMEARKRVVVSGLITGGPAYVGLTASECVPLYI
jgi:succinate dehydrogenase/fumarate reductase cytochrome b subunit